MAIIKYSLPLAAAASAAAAAVTNFTQTRCRKREPNASSGNGSIAREMGCIGKSSDNAHGSLEKKDNTDLNTGVDTEVNTELNLFFEVTQCLILPVLSLNTKVLSYNTRGGQINNNDPIKMQSLNFD